LAVRVAAAYDGAEASRAFGNGEVPVVNVAAVVAAAANTTIPTGRRCQGVRVDGRQRQRRAGGSGSGGRSGGRAAAEAAGGSESGGRSGGRAAAEVVSGQAGGDGGSVTSGLGCGDGAPCLAWRLGCELGDMPPVLGIPVRLGRPRPPTHFRPQLEFAPGLDYSAPRAKGPLL